MAVKSDIEWTDGTWNPVRGCTRVSPGCGGPGPHGGCYAEIMAARFSKPGQWGHGFAEMKGGDHRWTGKVALIEKMLLLPLHWRTPRRIFVNSTSDLFHEKLSDDAIDRVFAAMALCPQHTFQVLTKRPERMRQYFTETWQPAPAQDVDLGGENIHVPGETRRTDRWDRINGAIDDLTEAPIFKQDRYWTTDGSLIGRPAWPRQPLPNVWLGTSVEDQERADERIPHLLATPAAVRFLSCEPLLGPIDLTDIPWGADHVRFPESDNISDAFDALGDTSGGHIDWVIAGGESGPGARAMHPDWARSLRDQCGRRGVPFFFKQWGAWAPSDDDDAELIGVDPEVAEHDCAFNTGEAERMRQVGKGKAGRLLDGIEHNGFPEARP